MLVGEVIISARDQYPDPCQTLGSPSAPSLSQSVGAGSFALANVVYVIVTQVNQFGETVGSGEVPITISGSNNTVGVSATALPGATSGRAYVGQSSMAENNYVPLTLSGTTLTGTILSYSGGTGGFPPNLTSAYLPDTDGPDISAATIFRWLREGLADASKIAGGMLDWAATQAVADSADYVVPNGPWIQITDAWFDGYYLSNMRQRYQWRRNNIQGISFYWEWRQYTNQAIVTTYPTLNRTGGTTTVASTVGLTDTLITLTSLSSYLGLAPGMVQIDSEIIAYTDTNSSNQLIGCTRGWSGTTPATHQIGATATELNLQFRGYRQPTVYNVGSSNQTLQVPPGWETVIEEYLLYRYAKFEQDKQGAAEYLQNYTSRLAAISARPMKVSEIGSPSGGWTLYPGSPFGMIKQ